MGLVLSPRLCVQKGFSGYPDLHCVRKYGSVLGEMIYDPIGPTHKIFFSCYVCGKRNRATKLQSNTIALDL